MGSWELCNNKSVMWKSIFSYNPALLLSLQWLHFDKQSAEPKPLKILSSVILYVFSFWCTFCTSPLCITRFSQWKDNFIIIRLSTASSSAKDLLSSWSSTQEERQLESTIWPKNSSLVFLSNSFVFCDLWWCPKTVPLHYLQVQTESL